MALRLRAVNLHLLAITEDLRRRVVHVQRTVGCQKVILIHHQRALKTNIIASRIIQLIFPAERRDDLSDFLLHHQTAHT